MTISLAVFLAQVNSVLQASTDELSTVDRYEMIKAAVERYSRDKPDTRSEDVTGDGGKYYQLESALDRWSDGFSRVDSIQYPAPTIASDEQPVYLESEDWDDNYLAESGGSQVRFLYLPNHAPAATEAMRILYTLPYKWVASATTSNVAQVGHGLSVDDYIKLSGSDYVATEDVRQATHQVTAVADADNFTMGPLVVDVPQQDFFAIANLAACICCQTIAVRYSSATDTTINADSTAHTSRASEFASRATELCDKYAQHLGLGSEDSGQPQVAPANEFVHWPTGPEWPAGRRYIFHDQRRR